MNLHLTDIATRLKMYRTFVHLGNERENGSNGNKCVSVMKDGALLSMAQGRPESGVTCPSYPGVSLRVHQALPLKNIRNADTSALGI